MKQAISAIKINKPSKPQTQSLSIADTQERAFSAVSGLYLQRTVGNQVLRQLSMQSKESVQRRCACGKPTNKGNECDECGQKRLEQQPTQSPPRLLQRACNGGRWQHEYDGCSIPLPAALLISTVNKNNPARGRDTWFANRARTGPCDQHDRCYQTCNLSPQGRTVCDRQMYEGMMEVCRLSEAPPEIRGRCFHYAGVYYMGLRAFGNDAFRERQRQVCECRLGDFPTLYKGSRNA